MLHDENVDRAYRSAISTQLGCEALHARQDLCFSSVVSYVGTFVSTDLEGAIKSLGERGNDDVIERVNSRTKLRQTALNIVAHRRSVTSSADRFAGCTSRSTTSVRLPC